MFCSNLHHMPMVVVMVGGGAGVLLPWLLEQVALPFASSQLEAELVGRPCQPHMLRKEPFSLPALC